nr:MAG TPA: hypothetical protein [Caudoviricetes sp.]
MIICYPSQFFIIFQSPIRKNFYYHSKFFSTSHIIFFTFFIS